MTNTTVVPKTTFKVTVEIRVCEWCQGKFAWSDAQDKKRFCSREHELKDEEYA